MKLHFGVPSKDTLHDKSAGEERSSFVLQAAIQEKINASQRTDVPCAGCQLRLAFTPFACFSSRVLAQI